VKQEVMDDEEGRYNNAAQPAASRLAASLYI
jgi:hypothetical protein